MPVTIKTSTLKYKDPETGQYKGVDAVAETTTSQQVAAITSAGTTQVAAVNSAGTAKVSAVEAAGDAKISAIGDAGDAELDAIDAKAAEAIASVASIPEVEAMISGVFNSASNYKAGEYVIQEVNNVNKLYKFTADYTANDGWSNAQVVEVKVGSEVSDLKSALNVLWTQYKLATSKYTKGQYKISTGETAAESSRVRGYDYIADDVVMVRSTYNDISLIVAGWNSQDVYVGWYNGDFVKSGTGYLYDEISIANLREEYPGYKFKIMAQKANITVAEAADAIIYFKDDVATRTYVDGSVSSLSDTIELEIAGIEEDVSAINGKQEATTEITYNLINASAFANDNITVNDGIISGKAIDFNSEFSNGIPMDSQFKANTQYILTVYAYTNQASASTGNGLRFVFSYTDNTTSMGTISNATNVYRAFKFISTENKTISKISISFGSGNNNVWYLMNLQLAEGSEERPYIEHFTAIDLTARESIAELNAVEKESSLFATRKLLPEYYFGMPENPDSYDANDYMNERINAIPDGKHFIFITDVHWKNNNTHHSTAMMKYVKEKMGIKHIFFGGDVLNQEVSKYLAAARLAEYMNEVRDAFGSSYFPVQGNHDLNVANLSYVLEDNPGLTESDVRLSYRVVYKYFIEPIADKVVFEDCTAKLTQTGATGDDLAELQAYCKLHYYFDDDKQKIRYIVVCTTNTDDNGVVKTYFGAKSLQEMYLQYDWLYQALLNTPDEYDVIVFGHSYVWSGPTAPTGYRPYMPHGVGIALGRMLAGMRYHVNVTVRNTSNDATLSQYYAYGTHTYAFSSDTKKHDIVVGISGDKHFDGAYIVGPDSGINDSRIYDAMVKADKEVLLTVTLCDARAVPQEDYNDYKPTMTAETVNEQAFDVATITADHKLVYTRFGSGSDRTFTFPQ